jgi:outer membrane protein assembly factor BamA
VSPPGWDGGPNDLRPGGDVMGMGRLHAEWHLLPGLDTLAFLDTGRVWERLNDGLDPHSGLPVRGVHLADLQANLGGGLRIPSPLGALTLAAAWRLTPDPAYPVWDPGRFALHVVLGP